MLRVVILNFTLWFTSVGKCGSLPCYSGYWWYLGQCCRRIWIRRCFGTVGIALSHGNLFTDMCLRIRYQLRPSKTQDHFCGWCCYVSGNSCPVRLIWDSARTYTRENATLIHLLSQLQSEGPLSTIQIIFTLGWSFPFHKRRRTSAKSYYYPHYSSLWGSITLVGWMARMGDIPGRGSEMQIRSYSRRRYRMEAFFLWYAPLDPLQQWHYRQAKVRYPSKKIHIIIH